MKIINEFKAFVLRGNVLDLAIGIVIGAAFGAVVTAFVKDIITPLIAAIFGKPDFSQIGFTINHSRFLVGDFINALIAFISIAAVIFFVIIKPMNMVTERRKRGEVVDATVRPCPFCTTEIAMKATRCPFCTSDVSATAVA